MSKKVKNSSRLRRRAVIGMVFQGIVSIIALITVIILSILDFDFDELSVFIVTGVVLSVLTITALLSQRYIYNDWRLLCKSTNRKHEDLQHQ